MRRQECYQILGIEVNSSEEEIRKAYKSKALKYHPDKAPAGKEAEYEEKFKQIAKAYQILTNNERSDESFSFDPFSLFRKFFRTQTENLYTASNLVHELDASLESIYKGDEYTLHHEYLVLCSHCNGTRAETKEGKQMCKTCNGRGIRTQRYRGFISSHQCLHCSGEGFIVINTCKTCYGDGFSIIKEHVKILIPRGTRNNQALLVQGKGNFGGDLIVVVREILHEKFKRVGDDLMVEISISLRDALCGCTLYVDNLSKTKLSRLLHPPISPGSIEIFIGEGMPIIHTEQYGNLYARIDVVFPTEISEDSKEALKKILPDSPAVSAKM